MNLARTLPYLLVATVWAWGVFALGFDGRYGQDAYAYFSFGEALWGGRAYEGVFVWPVVYPLIGGLLGFQLVSLLSLWATIWFIGRILAGMWPDHRGITAFQILVLAASPMLLRSGLLVMSDQLAIALLAAGIYAARFSGGRWAALAALAFSLACYTRYQSFLIAAPFAIWVAWRFFKAPDWRYAPLIVAAICAGPLAQISAGLPLFPTGFIGGQLSNWSLAHALDSQFTIATRGEISFRFINLIYAGFLLVHPVFAPFGLLVLGFLRPKDFSQLRTPIARALLIGSLAYLLLVVGLPTQNTRFLLLAYPFIWILLFPAFQRGFLLADRLLPRFGGPAITTALVLVALYVFNSHTRPLVEVNQREGLIAQTLAATASGETLYSFGTMAMVDAHNLPVRYVSLWEQPIEAFDLGALVLVNEARMNSRNRSVTTGQNWENLTASRDMSVVRAFEKGWVLFRIDGVR